MSDELVPGVDYPGVGVGVIVFNSRGEVLVGFRGPECRNEQNCWEFPGGGFEPEIDQTIVAACVREIFEEANLKVSVKLCAGTFVHRVPGQVWVVPVYIAELISPQIDMRILEESKCAGLTFKSWDEVLELDLSVATRECVRILDGFTVYGGPSITELLVSLQGAPEIF